MRVYRVKLLSTEQKQAKSPDYLEKRWNFLAPGEYPWIPLATVSTPNGYNAQEEPGFIVLKSRGFSCSSNHSLHVEGTARIALNIKLIRFQFEIALLLLFSLFCSSYFWGVGGWSGGVGYSHLRCRFPSPLPLRHRSDPA